MEAPSPPRLANQNYVDDAWHSGSKGTVEGQPALRLGGVAASSLLSRAVPERKEKEERKSKEKEKEKEKSKSKEEEVKSKSKEKEKSKKPWAGRLILGAAVAVGVVVVVVGGAFVLLSAIGDSDSVAEEDEDDPSGTMKAPGSGGRIISRDRFEENPKNYFRTLRERGPEDAVDDFQ